MADRDKRGWPIHGEVGVELERLVDLYKANARVAGAEDKAVIATAEAIAAESTALTNPAAEASAFIAADAVRNIVKGK